MKKIILAFLFLAGLSSFVKAQHAFKVSIAQDLCLSHLTIVFTDESTTEIDLGCSGEYSFSIGDHTVQKIVINNVTCEFNVPTDVEVNNHVYAKAKLSQASPRELNDPGVTLQ